jgi:O-antigen/teichoic acid export membrane protein
VIRTAPWPDFMKTLRTPDGQLRRTVLLVGAGILAAGLDFTFNIAIALFLGPESFGNVKTVWGFARFLLTLAEIGISATAIRFIALYRGAGAEGAARYLIRRLYLLRFLIAVALVIPIILFRSELAALLLNNPLLAPLFIPGALIVAAASLDLGRSIITGLQSFGLLASANVLVSGVVLAVGLPLTLTLGAPGALYASAIAIPLGTLGVLSGVVRYLRAGPVEAAEPVRRLLVRYALPLHVVSLPSLLVAESIPLLSLLFPQNVIGHYAFAFTFAGTIPLLAGTISQVLLPATATDVGRGDLTGARARFTRTLLGYFALAVLGAAVAVTAGPPLIRALAPTYAASAWLAALLTAFAFFHSSLTVVGNYLIALGRLKWLAWANLVAGASWLGVSFLLLSAFRTRL